VTTRILYLKNNGTETLENISLVLSDSLKDFIVISPDNIGELETGEQIQIVLNISSVTSGVVEGQITAMEHEEPLYSYCEVSLNFIDSYVASGNETVIYSTKTCEELGGFVCEESESCSDEDVLAKDSVCCLSECESADGNSGFFGKFFGWFLFIAVITFAGWFVLTKYKGAKRVTNLLSVAKGKK